jgi:outer membrane protein assembly factor BamA
MTRFVLGLAVLIACTPAFSQTPQIVTVRNLTLVNLTQVPVEDYQQIVQFALNDKPTPATPDVISERVRYALQERGYFRAEVGDPETTLVSEDPAEKIIDVSVRVNPGSIYKLQELILAGNRAFPADELRAQLPFKPGDVFNTGKVGLGLDNLRKFYADDGYINFIPVPRTTVIEETKQIILEIVLKEGKRFYFGDLNLTGLILKPEAAQAAVADWSSLKGKLYNRTDLEEFIMRHPQLGQNLAIRQNAQAGTVSLELQP